MVGAGQVLPLHVLFCSDSFFATFVGLSGGNVVFMEDVLDVEER